MGVAVSFLRSFLPKTGTNGTPPSETTEWEPLSQRDGVPAGPLVGLLYRAVRARPLFVALTISATLAATALWVRSQPSSYRATAVVRLADERRALTTGLEAPEVSPERTVNLLLSQIQLLRSRVLVGAVVDAEGLRLRPNYEEFPARLLTGIRVDSAAQRDTLRLRFRSGSYEVRSAAGGIAAAYGQPVELGGVRFTVSAAPKAEEATWLVQSREEAIDHTLANLKVTPRAMTNVIDVAYTSPKPAVAQRVVNALIETFQAANATAAQQQSRRRRQFLETQIEQQDSLLLEAQLALSTFRSAAQLSSSRDKLAAQQRDLMAVDVRREELESQSRMYRSLIDGLSKGDDERDRALRTLVATPEIGQNPAVAALYRQLAEYERARDSLTTGAWRSAATHPDVVRLDELIASTEQKLGEVVRSHVSGVDARIAALRDLRSRGAQSISVLPEMEAREMRLMQRVETMRKMVDALREEHQKARVAEAVEAGQVEIVDRAALPYRSVPRLRGLKLALGLILGLVLGLGGAVALESMNSSLRRRDEIERALGVPSLALIPNVRPALPAPSRGRFAALLPGPGETPPASSAAPLISLVPVTSVAAEAYRVLRTNLLFWPQWKQLKTIAVTSAVPSEGKTITAANLAITFARERRQVLLVDCDFRRPRLHRLFRISRAPGLAEILASSDDNQVPIWETSVDGLAVLAAGGSPETAATSSDLMHGPRLRQLLASVSERFDIVVLDTPPVLALSDAAVVGALADATLLVVRAGGTQRGAAQDALRQLEAVGAHVMGVVLNDPAGASPEHSSYKYYNQYADVAGS